MTQEEQVEKFKNVYLHVLITGHLLMTLNDELEGTSAYKQKLKMATKTQQQELMKMVEEDLSLLWGNLGEKNDKTLYKCMENQEGFIRQVVEIGCADYAILNSILKRYKEDKDTVLDLLSINVVKDESIQIK